ncbi:MAG: formate dehydrogenase subunit gamma [Sphingomonadaceae bacterium]
MQTQAARVTPERGDGPGTRDSVLTPQSPKRGAVGQAAPLRIEPSAEPCGERQIVRFNAHQRAQHFIMMTSVLLLVFTGMPQKFFDAAWSQWLINLWGGLDSARNIHHLAGFAMLFAGFYHVAYMLHSILVRKEPVPIWMFPSLKDFRDFFQNTGYYLGIVKEKPKFGRFSYFEKFDYFAVFWGVPVMGITGLILMYPLVATKFLPGVVVPVATIAHSDEAMLATGWLFVVHFYNAHLAPHIFPFNKSIFTGRVPESRYKKEHPLEYQERVVDQEL